MATITKKSDFLESAEGLELKEILEHMVEDNTYCTDPSYSANSDLYPDHSIPFVDKHMHYMRTHPATDRQYYIANLRLITRIR